MCRLFFVRGVLNSKHQVVMAVGKYGRVSSRTTVHGQGQTDK